MDWQTSSTLLERLGESREQDGWRLLVDHFRDPIVRLGRRLGLDEAEAEDAAQNTLMAFSSAYRAGRYDKGKGRLRQWLFGIASRQVRNSLRAARTRGARQAAVGSHDGLAALPAPGTGETVWEEEWRRGIFERSLAQVEFELSPQTCTIFRMLVFQECDADEVVKCLGVSRSLVYNAKYRVAKRLGELARAYEDC